MGISKNIYENTVMLAFELGEGYSDPISENPLSVTDITVNAYEALQACRKRLLIRK